MRLFLLVLTSAVLAAGPVSHQPAPVAVTCVRANTDTVALTGMLKRDIYPGPPNFESVRKGDEPQAGFYLHLAAPVCVVNPDGPSADTSAIVQLNLDSAGYASLRPSLNHRTTVRGTLYGWDNALHHVPVLMWVNRR